MIKVGKEYTPTAAKITKGGKYTQFTIPQKHRVGDRYFKDGFLNVLVNGEYMLHEGDTIVIKEITAATLVKWKDKQYFSIYAVIEYKTAEQNRAGDNRQTLDDDIPEELL